MMNKPFLTDSTEPTFTKFNNIIAGKESLAKHELTTDSMPEATVSKGSKNLDFEIDIKPEKQSLASKIQTDPVAPVDKKYVSSSPQGVNTKVQSQDWAKRNSGNSAGEDKGKKLSVKLTSSTTNTTNQPTKIVEKKLTGYVAPVSERMRHLQWRVPPYYPLGFSYPVPVPEPYSYYTPPVRDNR
uniref:Uncharacterized protein n=1 Tax=Candidatus Kentrum sp. TUN TaxID=2126343 RepID=A0A450ZAN5_9GAMM|nr:MAG: hypothetical protein BECKTUN1418D_GA0071000_100246 [Candidatus Kentron sp. TUN]